MLKGNSFQKIDKIRIDNSKQWDRKHLNLLYENYSTSKYFERYYGKLEEILSRKWEYLVDLDMELIYWLADELGIVAKYVFSEDLNLNDSKSTMRLIRICQELNGDVYLSGSRGRNYIKEDLFQLHGINLEYHDYKHPEYKQNFEGFESYMSIIDLMFNHGDESLKILTKGRLEECQVNLQKSI